MFKTNEIAVVTQEGRGGFFFNVYACDKDAFMAKKYKYRLVDKIAGQFRDALIEMDCQEFVFITEDGKCCLNQLH